MDVIKKTENLTFEVIYSDGAARKVDEGVLFEFKVNNITLHLGTERKECLFSIAEALTELIAEAGLGEEFKSYIEQSEME